MKNELTQKCSLQNQFEKQTRFKKYQLETPFNTTTQKQGQNVKFSKIVSLFLVPYSNVFNNCFVFSLLWRLNNRFIMVLTSAYDQKCHLRSLVLKTNATIVQKLRLIILDLLT